MREMKDSGIEWIGSFPGGWSLERLQWHIREIVEKNDPIITNQVLSLTNKKGVIPYEEKGAQGNTAKENYSDYKIAYPDTIVANSMNILIGSVGYSHYYGCVSPVYYVFRENSGNDLRFVNYIMQTTQFQKELRKHANGILEIRLRVSSNDILKTKCAFPLYEEQKRIADYLDSKCAKIDFIIEKQQAIIEKLKEYITSYSSEFISHSDSIKIPIGKVVKSIEQGWSPSPAERDEQGEWKVLTLAAIKSGVFKRSEHKPFKESGEKCEKLLLRKGDFLLTRANTRDLVGQVCIVDEVEENTIFSDLIYRVKFDETFVLPEYMVCYFQTSMMRQQIRRDAHGSNETMVKITHKDINSWTFDMPSLLKQKEMVVQINKKNNEITNEICKRMKIVKKLEEYKKSLIYEVVTGKRGVFC